LPAKAVCQVVCFFDGVHIHCCGNGHLWFRFYNESLWKSPKVTKGLLPRHSVPRPGSACPHSGIAPGARRHRPSMAGGGYRGILAAVPPTQHLRSASGKGAADQDQDQKPKQRQDQQLREQARSHRGDVHLQETGRLSGRLRSDAATRQASSHKKSERIRCAFHHSTGRALARLQLLMLTHRPLERPRGGSAQWATRHGCRVSRARPWMADRGGPTEQDRSEGMPSLGEAPNERGKSVLVTLALFQSDPL
jgi:hypothetical protein